MRLPKSAHTSRTWRIHEIAPDFLLYDVWALPTPGGPGDFPRLVRQMTTGGPSLSGAARALWDLRWKVGGLLGWDRPDAGMGHRVPTLRDRLPPDLRARRPRELPAAAAEFERELGVDLASGRWDARHGALRTLPAPAWPVPGTPRGWCSRTTRWCGGR